MLVCTSVSTLRRFEHARDHRVPDVGAYELESLDRNGGFLEVHTYEGSIRSSLSSRLASRRSEEAGHARDQYPVFRVGHRHTLPGDLGVEEGARSGGEGADDRRRTGGGSSRAAASPLLTASDSCW